MSATGRTEGLREADDFYETPAWATRAILPHLEMAGGEGAIVLDPYSRGVGRFWRWCARCGRPSAAYGIDPQTQWWHGANLVLTNPPYKHAEAAIRRAHAKVVVRATEYAWFVWGPMRGGRWSILDVEG